MTQAIDVANEAHKVWQGRSEVLKRLREQLNRINAELEAIDSHAKANEGRVMAPAPSGRSPEEILKDKAATEAAIIDAEKRASEAEEDFKRKNSIVISGGS